MADDMFEKDEKTGMLKPVWERARRSRMIQDVASTKTGRDLEETRAAEEGISFEVPSGWWWAATDREVRFTLRKDGRTVLCRMPEAWLAARYGGAATGEALLEKAREDFDLLTDIAEGMLEKGATRPDGSLLFGAAPGDGA